MSLASRLANLSIPNQAPHLAQTDGQSTVTIGLNSYNAGDTADQDSGNRHPQKSGTMEEKEEENRPPYWQVSPVSQASTHC
jgi:hypothetical protein